MPIIDKITIRGFRSIRSIEEMELLPINVLIGANGSGKSNFVNAFELIQTVLGRPERIDRFARPERADRFGRPGRTGRFARPERTGRFARPGRTGRFARPDRADRFARPEYIAALTRYVAKRDGADNILHFGSKRTKELTFQISETTGHKYRLSLEPTFNGELRVRDEIFGCLESPPDSRRAIRYRTQFRLFARSWQIYHFHDTGQDSPLKKTNDLHDNRFLRADGSNLAAYLYLLRERHHRRYEMITGVIRMTAPFFDDFILEPSKLNPDKIRLEWRHTGSDAYFDASSLSDGTLRFMALATLLYQPEELVPPVILLDEPELGLHPHAITLLASLVKSITATQQKQVIMATQSPTLLNHFEPEDVLVANRLDGATELTRLNSEELEVWLEDYNLGELWMQNEFGGRPKPELRPYR